MADVVVGHVTAWNVGPVIYRPDLTRVEITGARLVGDDGNIVVCPEFNYEVLVAVPDDFDPCCFRIEGTNAADFLPPTSVAVDLDSPYIIEAYELNNFKEHRRATTTLKVLEKACKC